METDAFSSLPRYAHSSRLMLRYSWTFLRDQLLRLQQQHMQGNTITPTPQVQPLPPFFALQPAPSPLMLPPPSEAPTVYAPSEVSEPSDGSLVHAPSEVSIHPSEMSVPEWPFDVPVLPDLQAPHLIQQSSQQPSSSGSFAVFEEVGDDATSSSASESSWRVRWHRRSRRQELD